VLEESLGVPDGLSVDSEGGIWVAMWGGSKVIRVSPDRKVDVQVEVGTKNITSCAFDSANNLLITTATAALSEEELGVRGAGGIWILEQAKHGFQGLKPWVFGVRHN
jgi:sugar lactone lactonase YvrE